MQFSYILTCLITFLVIPFHVQTSTSKDIREFIHTTNLMSKLGVRIAASLSTDINKSKLGLLIGIDPSSLVLVPEEFVPNTSDKLKWNSRDCLIPITDRIQDLKLVCYNQKVRKSFPEWGILELCKGKSHEVFAAFLMRFSQKNARLAVSRGDLENAPIIELGMLRCLRKHGSCASSRPNDMELASILASVEGSLVLITSSTMSVIPPIKEDPTSVKDLPSTATLVLTITSVFQMQSKLSNSGVSGFNTVQTLTQYPSSASIYPTSKTGLEKITTMLEFNTLDGPPNYRENPVAFEAYRSRLKLKKTSPSKTWPGVVWVKTPPKTTSMTVTSILTTTVTELSPSSTPTSYYQVMGEDIVMN